MTAPITILEGPDGAGKTYRANRLVDAYRVLPGVRAVSYVHNDPPAKGTTSRELYRLYLGQLVEALELRDHFDRATVIDRSWPSEFVYGTVYRGGSLLTLRQINKLEQVAALNGITRIGLEAPDTVREERILSRDEDWDPLQPAVGVAYTEYFQSFNGWDTAGSLPATH